MATHVEERRERVKDYLGIEASVPTFDSDIDNYVADAVKDLWPLAQKELPAYTLEITDTEDRRITLTSGEDVAMFEFEGQPIGSLEWKKHGTEILFDRPFGETGTLEVFPLGRYVMGADAGTASTTTVPEELYTTVDYWAVAKFYIAAAGNRRKYSSFNAGGPAANRDMKDSAAFWLQQGTDHLLDRASPEGG